MFKKIKNAQRKIDFCPHYLSIFEKIHFAYYSTHQGLQTEAVLGAVGGPPRGGPHMGGKCLRHFPPKNFFLKNNFSKNFYFKHIYTS